MTVHLYRVAKLTCSYVVILLPNWWRANSYTLQDGIINSWHVSILWCYRQYWQKAASLTIHGLQDSWPKWQVGMSFLSNGSKAGSILHHAWWTHYQKIKSLPIKDNRPFTCRNFIEGGQINRQLICTSVILGNRIDFNFAKNKDVTCMLETVWRALGIFSYFDNQLTNNWPVRMCNAINKCNKLCRG